MLAKEKWLQIILAERYGHFFNLIQGAGFTRLSVNNSESFIEIKSDLITFSRNDSNLDCATWDAAAEGWHTILNIPLMTPGTKNLEVPLIKKTGTIYRINYDILGLTYWMLTRQEEVGRTDLDHHRRFPASASHAYKYGYLDRPIVDEWLDILGQVIRLQWPELQLRTHQFSIKVSHDVDIPSRYSFCSFKRFIRAMLVDIVKYKNWNGAICAPWVRMFSKNSLHPADPANTFDWIMDVSERNGLTSAFYFICGRTDPVKDADYELDHPAIRKLMRDIHHRKHEIGLHPSYNTYQNSKAIAIEANHLKNICKEEGIQQIAWGSRMHYLRWEHQTMRALNQSGMSYDSTLGYADSAGFRCGTCFEYPAFDPVTQQALNLRIRPLIVMECSIMDACYMGLGRSELALNKMLEYKSTCRAVNGCFTLLWHNSEFTNLNERLIYEKVLSG